MGVGVGGGGSTQFLPITTPTLGYVPILTLQSYLYQKYAIYNLATLCLSVTPSCTNFVHFYYGKSTQTVDEFWIFCGSYGTGSLWLFPHVNTAYTVPSIVYSAHWVSCQFTCPFGITWQPPETVPASHLTGALITRCPITQSKGSRHLQREKS